MGYRNAATIERAVHSVLGQRCAEPFDVVVVVSGDDESEALVRRAFPDVPVVASPTRLMPGGARNTGVAATRGEFVAFLAADCVAEPGWVEHRLRAHRQGWRAVASALTNGEPRRIPAWAQHFDLYSGRLAGRPAGVVAFPDHAAHGLSYSRAVLDELGPFDAAMRAGEDSDMARRLANAAVDVWFEPAVRTAHFGPRTTGAMVRDRYARGARAAALAPSTVPARFRTGVVSGARRTRTAVVESWRNAGPDRWWVPAAVPWIVLGRIASTAGAQRVARQDGRGARRRIDARTPGARRASS